ncbi:dNTP triphosphohydrolase [Anaerosalibacter bizertensis]|uniref:DNTP triphosphohydrolase n=1 Tax=Anaerosalibacter bizertensis TaxID=932217 RepID=A0A9Q4FLK3_9FIRM|nr:dNTP triphosphohydrolase [Anaerosalibacter bizertensis]MBV1819560.1 dNTP triphosphohydrolase [Bacteroidales bacterium MSK.15.36]MCB5559211.1 dNTP triphosphohydrolase [Anaerosalibacter bizertensis]MCG4565866.1 dNTP triphosphohydrolase [Anaerosalibacter bizertensis]MCG4583440.1 dNTP triphosphohydrolase [Anaerosalibacter bizertensis]
MDKTNNFSKYSIKGIDLERRENKNICEWGVKHEVNSNKNKEETHRTDFRRQRDRILYTGGFRRLQDKTQVIAATKNGDHRTRLTHSLEVEQIAVSIADALGLNRDLVSAIALGHDVGHTPFGHAVERFLDDKLKDKGGFSHAVQSVRYLKKRKVRLSAEVWEGILKHDTDVYAGAYDKRQFDCGDYFPKEPGNLESQVVYWADKLAYLTHDFEDFYETEIYKNAKEYHNDLESELQDILANLITEEEKSKKIKEDIKKFETRDLIRNVLRNLIDESLKNINKLKVLKITLDPDVIKDETKYRIEKIEINKGIDNVRNEDEKRKIKKEAYQKGLIINFNEDYYNYYLGLRKILDDHYISSPEVQRSDAKAIKIVESLYDQFINNYKILPLNVQKEIKEKKYPRKRVVADYIASMTDRYAEEIFTNLNSIGSYYDY